MNPHLTKIEKAVKLACTEIMELKFGCRIKAHPSAHDQTVYVILGKEGNFWNCLEQIDTKLGHAHVKMFGENAGFEILGHPIRLEHVLRTLEDASAVVGSLLDSPDGQKSYIEHIFLLWYLTQPLSGQSPECLKFIASLLPES